MGSRISLKICQLEAYDSRISTSPYAPTEIRGSRAMTPRKSRKSNCRVENAIGAQLAMSGTRFFGSPIS